MPNSYLEGLLQNAYGGTKGCFVSFMHFFYQYNQSVVFAEEMSEFFDFLQKTELENCKILSQILVKMGGDCKYFSAYRKFLSGYNVEYLKNFKDIFAFDREILELGIIEIRNIISKTEDENIKKCLQNVLKNKQKCLEYLRENYLKHNIVK